MTGKKHVVTDELASTYPDWSRVRTDETSVGYQFLNALSGPLDKGTKALVKHRANVFLSTANIDEIDITHKVVLPKTFEFDTDDTDPLQSVDLYPLVSGEYDGTWYQISGLDENSIEAFWYTSIPTRASIDLVVSGVEDTLLEFEAQQFPVSGEFRHHLADTSVNGGRLWVEAVGGVQYIRVTDDKTVSRGRVVLSGRTRKGTDETETIVFPWDMKQPSTKEWEYLTRVDCFDVESGVDISVRSSNVLGSPHLSPWNIRFSKDRRKIDEFWDLDLDDDVNTLARAGYVTDEWQQLVLGFSSKESKRRFELLNSPHGVIDDPLNTIEPVDLAVQPFADRVWVTTDDANLYLYDLQEDIPSGIDKLKGSTPGAHVALDFELSEYVRGDTVKFTPIHVRPLKEIRNYQVYYTTPEGTVTELANEILMDGEELRRTIGTMLSFEADQRGTYMVQMDVMFIDNEEQTFKALVPIHYKLPLCHLDLSEEIDETVEGLEFDSDQRLWVKTTPGDFYRIKLHSDIMLVDFSRKVVYLKEDYSEVHVGE